MKSGWEVKPLGNVCLVTAGQSPQGMFYNQKGDGMPFYQGKKEFGNRYLGKPQKWTTKVTKIAKPGDIVISVRAPVGPVNQVVEEVCIGRGLASIRSSTKLPQDYLWYFLLSMQSTLTGEEGATFSSINKSAIEAIPIPLPFLDEQKRIVEILDKAFAAIESARAFTQANPANADELFQSILHNTFSNSKAKGWEVKPLGEVAEIRPPKKQVKKHLQDKDAVSFVPMSDLNIDNPNMNLRITEKLAKVYGNYTYFADGDVILAKITPCFENRKIGIASGLTNGVGFGSSEFVVIRPGQSLLASYLYHFLNRASFRAETARYMTGTAGQKRVPSRLMQAMPIPLPSLDKQQRIVSKLNQLHKHTTFLKQQYETKLADLDELRKSLLEKAFTGELT